MGHWIHWTKNRAIPTCGWWNLMYIPLIWAKYENFETWIVHFGIHTPTSVQGGPLPALNESRTPCGPSIHIEIDGFSVFNHSSVQALSFTLYVRNKSNLILHGSLLELPIIHIGAYFFTFRRSCTPVSVVCSHVTCSWWRRWYHKLRTIATESAMKREVLHRWWITDAANPRKPAVLVFICAKRWLNDYKTCKTCCIIWSHVTKTSNRLISTGA